MTNRDVITIRAIRGIIRRRSTGIESGCDHAKRVQLVDIRWSRAFQQTAIDEIYARHEHSVMHTSRIETTNLPVSVSMARARLLLLSHDAPSLPFYWPFDRLNKPDVAIRIAGEVK